MTTSRTPWQPWQKFSFRFFFIFLGVTAIHWSIIDGFFCYEAVFEAKFQSLSKLYEPLNGLFHWLDRLIYHTGYDPKLHTSLPMDNHFGVVFGITLILLAIITSVVWSILDKKRTNYDKLQYWFSFYLRYLLGITILTYGIDKVIPVQMPYPNALAMQRYFGNVSHEDLLWFFMGVSPGYMIFTGSCELLAAFLLFSQRTAVFGYLLMIAVLTNVVLLNWFYNISVKLSSSILLLYAFYLVAPWVKNIFRFFFTGTPAAIVTRRYVFERKWKTYLLRTILILVPLLFIVPISINDLKSYRRTADQHKRDRVYNVTNFVIKDTVATDAIRWKRVFFVYGNYIMIRNMKDKLEAYTYDIDSLKKTFILHTDNDKNPKILRYAYPAKDSLRLSGKWKGKDISVSLKSSPVDSMFLNKEKIKIMQD